MNTSFVQLRHSPPRFAHAQRGIALFVGLVFLVVLSLVAVIAMQGTLMEMRMVTNVARHQEAFQTSEAGRTVLTAPGTMSLFAQNIVNRGWPKGTCGGKVPVDFQGNVPCTDFDFSGLNATIVRKFASALLAANGGTAKLLFGPLDAGENPASPGTWVKDATLLFSDPTVSGGLLASELAVVPDGRGVIPGSGAAQAAGYRGLGVGLAGGGAALFFQVKSTGWSPANKSNGRAVTISQYKAVVQ